MSRAQMATLRLYKDGTSYLRWQNFYVNTSITFDSASWDFFPFEFGGIAESSAPGGGELSISLPASGSVISRFCKAQTNLQLCEVKLFEFDARLYLSAPPASPTEIASHLGQVLDFGGSFTRVEVGLGSVLSPVGSQVPPRTYSTALIGAPVRK